MKHPDNTPRKGGDNDEDGADRKALSDTGAPGVSEHGALLPCPCCDRTNCPAAWNTRATAPDLDRSHVSVRERAVWMHERGEHEGPLPFDHCPMCEWSVARAALEKAKAALERAVDAIASLPREALGVAGYGDDAWPLRDELLGDLRAALAAIREVGS